MIVSILNKPISRCQTKIRHQLVKASGFNLTSIIIMLLSLLTIQAYAINIEQYDAVYQIQVQDNSSAAKSAIGSGFMLEKKQIIVTNYHVISQYVAKPENYNIVLQNQAIAPIDLTLVSFDVINDIALLVVSDEANWEKLPLSSQLKLATEFPKQGQSIHAMGNPHNLGIKLVTGIYNGFVEHRFNQQILFSGSLNAGMSGGPTVNNSGEVIGVNVATAGGQLSFLVPFDKVSKLVKKYNHNGAFATDDYHQITNDQILSYQQMRYESLLDSVWQPTQFAQIEAVAEIRDDIQCWGDRNRDDNPKVMHRQVRLSCRAGDSIYIENNLSSGQIHYSFNYYFTDELNSLQFSHLLSQSSFNPDNNARERHVTNYECEQQHVSLQSNDDNNLMALCIRAYKNYPDLYDALYYSIANRNNQGFIAHFTLAGVSKDITLMFTQKFTNAFAWNDDDE